MPAPKHRALLTLALFFGTGPLATAQSRSALTREQVVAAARQTGVALSLEQVSLTAGLTASGPSTSLQIEGVEEEGSLKLRLRLRCTGEASCFPFLSTISFPDVPSAHLAEKIFRSSFSPSLPTRTTAVVTVRPGQRMHLLLQSTHMQISLPVISIDAGSAGSEVRVSSLDRKQLFRGVVSDGTTVQAVLP